MAIANKNDLTHIVRTTQQWTSSYDSYECIPEGVLCVEFTPDGHVKAKIGNGHDIFSKLPYIGGADLTNYFTKNETVKCIEDIIKAKRFICIKGILQNKDQLPSHAECGDLYFVISQNQSSSNKYDEYVYSPSNTWENLGSIPIDIDLSEYAKIVYVDEKIDEVNERIDDIEQHGTHTHANKDILDLITASFTAEEKDKLSTLYNYDDTELRELITQALHTHSNKDILDAISAAFTAEDRVKLDSLTPYDDTILKEKITALERLAHEHSNKRILDRTTASFTTEYERKMRWIRLYTGCTGMEEGIAGLVPAAQAGEEDYVLSGSGEWVPQTGGGGTYELPIASASVLGGIKVGDGLEIDENGVLSATGGGGGDSIAEGEGINITTDPQTGVKTISVDTGNGLQINQDGELEIDPSIIPEAPEYRAGKAIEIEHNEHHLSLTDYSNNDFIASIILSVTNGSISKAADNSSFVLSSSYDDCYTRGSNYGSNGSYPYTVKPLTQYRLQWDSASPGVTGYTMIFENGEYTYVHVGDQGTVSYIDFTTAETTTFIQVRFGIAYAGNTISISNIRLYEYVEDAFEYDKINVKYNKGLVVNQNNELEVVLSDGLQFDSTASETMVADEMYLFDSRVTCQVHTDSPYPGSPTDRIHQKTNDEPALFCLWEVYDSGYLWTGPLLVGLTSTSVQYTTQDTSRTVNYQNTFTYLGKTWYTSGYPDYLNDADHEDKLGHVQYLGSYAAVSYQIQAAKDLIDLANIRFVSNAGIQAKLGNGLSFDSNGAIQADAQPLSPATDSTLGGVIVGDGILVDNDGTISVDPTIIPEITEYEGGTAISIEEVEHGGVTFDAWDSGTGWENVCYSNSTGNSVTSYRYEAHSPISNSYTLPTGATRIRAIAYNQNDTMLWTSFSWIDANDYHFASTSPEDGHYDDWFEIPTGAVKVNFGVRHSKLNNTTAMSLNDIKSVNITIQTASEIEVDVWNGGTGWLNGDYGSGTSNDFYTNWYYTYHYNYQQYIEVPEGATHVMVKGISNENDSHFEGGGCNAFDSNHNHVYWWACAWEWQEISSDVKYVQPNVKWDDNNTRTISGSDVKSVTLVWKLPSLEINQAINVKYGDGLTVNQNNELEVNLGSGLQFDANGAIEVTGGSGDTIAEGDGITITTDSQTGVKTIGINVGDGLEIDPLTNELFVNGQLPEGTIIKKLTYVGNGSGSSNVIKFTKKPVGILSINGSSGTNYISAIPASINSEYLHGVYGGVSTNGNPCSCRMSYNDATNELTFTQAYNGNNDPGLIYNVDGKTYTMQYLVKGHAGSGTSETNMVSVVKTFSYVGTGTSTNNIQFPETPDMLLSIAGIGGDNTYLTTTPTPMDAAKLDFAISDGSNNNGVGGALMSFNDTTNVLTLTSSRYDSWAFNTSGVTYQVRYIVNEVIASSIGGGTNYIPGEGIEFTELSNSLYADKVRMEITGIKSYSQSGSYAPYVQMRYLEFSDENHDEITLTSGTGIWDDGTPVEYPNPGESIDAMITEMIANTGKMIATKFDGTKSLILTFDLSEPVLYDDLQYLRYKTGDDASQRDPISWKIYFNNTNSVNNWNLAAVVESATITNNRETWTQYFPLAVNEFNTVVISATGGSGDTVAEGNGISITTDQQTGEKVISVNAGSGLQINQTTHELEPKLGDGLELDEYNAITVDPFYPNTLILNCVLDDEPSSDLILHFTLDPDE